MRGLGIGFVLAACASAPTGQAPPAPGGVPAGADSEEFFRARAGPFLKRHCVGCHGPERPKGQVRLDRLDGFRAAESPLWTRIHERLSEGNMPPEDRTRPPEADTKALLAWIEKRQREVRTGGVRRLNRRELSAALQDLTGLRVDFAASLPGEGTLDGFDTGADALQDTSDSVEQAMEVTRRAVEGLRFLDPPRSAPRAVDFRAVKDLRKAFEGWGPDGEKSRLPGTLVPGKGLLLPPQWVGERADGSLFVAPPAGRRGILRLKVTLSALKNRAEIPYPHLWVDIGGQTIDAFEITAPADAPIERVYEVQVEDLAVEPRGIRVTLRGMVEVPYAVPGFENEERNRPGEPPVPGGTGLFRPAFDRKKLPVEEQPVPFVVLHRLEIDPDFTAPWPPAESGIDPGPLRDDPESARRLLGLWMDRAYRRPPAEAEQAPFFEFYRKERRNGASFDGALRAAFQAVLLSAPFRFLPSTSDSDPVIAQYAIASRLGFMLAGAPPDAELRRLAAAGRLRDPAVLDAQVDRLLSGERGAAFFRPFVTQWLELGQPVTIAMDDLRRQDFRFARHLKESMREETLGYVSRLFLENRPAEELVASDWTMMNRILAIHYGYPPLEGAHLRPVRLRPDDPRGGGLLGHAGIQSMLCWMGDNWVVYRGAWVLRRLLDAPPPPPPLEVPELNPSDPAHQGRTVKELLRRHREDPRCATCHETIDPLGFAFQNFDLSGRWRSVEFERYEKKELDGKVEWRGAGRTRPVDASGKLPRGEEFSGFAEWKRIVVRNYREDLVRGLLKHLLVYATGRRPDVADLAEVRAVLREQAPGGYRLRDLLKAVVRSRAFLGSS